MMRKVSQWLCFSFLLLNFCGCSPSQPAASSEVPEEKTSSGTVPETAYFKTSFTDETQYIVETVLVDLAEMAFYAREGRLPEAKSFRVTTVETPGSKLRNPVYDCEVVFREGDRPLRFSLTIQGSVWSPETFRDASVAIFDFLQLTNQPSGEQADTSFLVELTDGKAATIEKQNQIISSDLQENFLSASLHERAAALLGVFVLKEAAGHFYDARPALCRTAAHLTMAQALSGNPERGTIGKIAEIMLYTGMGNQKDALKRLESLSAADLGATIWSRILRAKNTSDYRELSRIARPTPAERIALFEAYSKSSSVGVAWEKLERKYMVLPDFFRIANELGFTVEVGHSLSRASVSLEKREQEEIYTLWQGEALKPENWAGALNVQPDRCFSRIEDRLRVRIIGWGQWAGFLQRHHCHALRENYFFLRQKLGLRDEARDFAAEWSGPVSQLRLSPVLLRIRAADQDQYQSAVDALYSLTSETPHLVSPQGWNYLLWQNFHHVYAPQTNTYVNDWHRHNPPPGTAYHFYPRLDHASLTGRPDFVSLMEEMHDIAPFHKTIAWNLIQAKYGTNGSFEQLSKIYGPMLEYSAVPIVNCAELVKDRPEMYEELMLRASELQPRRYIDLAKYFQRRTNEAKAVYYTEKRIEHDPDAVGVAADLSWLINHYLDKGNTNRAAELADFGGEVYSQRGLLAKAQFLERTQRYDEAFQWYRKIEERYNSWKDLVNFCLRYRTATGDARFHPELEKRVAKIFPSGMQKVTLQDFHSAPKHGVVIYSESELLQAAGLKKGEIIVALDGIRLTSMMQYSYVRDATDSALNLLVWDGHGFREVSANPPNRRFNADFRDYTAK